MLLSVAADDIYLRCESRIERRGFERHNGAPVVRHFRLIPATGRAEVRQYRPDGVGRGDAYSGELLLTANEAVVNTVHHYETGRVMSRDRYIIDRSSMRITFRHEYTNGLPTEGSGTCEIETPRNNRF